MSNYADCSYHQLRRLYGNIPAEDNAVVASLIADYYRRIIERSLTRQHPDWSAGELKAAVFERMYRGDFSAEEMTKIKVWFRSHL